MVIKENEKTTKKGYKLDQTSKIIMHVSIKFFCVQPYKTLLIDTLWINKMYKGIRKKKKENLHDVKLAQTRSQNLSMSKIDHL
jgi:hypothetical protein